MKPLEYETTTKNVEIYETEEHNTILHSLYGPISENNNFGF